MAGYNLKIKIRSKFHQEAKSFLKFLQNIGKKYPIQITYRTIKLGEFYVTINGTPGAKIDAFFQEIILNKGLYYYSYTIPDRHAIIKNVVKPIFQQLLESRFERTYSRLLRRHILGKISDPFMPGDFFDESAHKYEMLFRKWDLNLISNYDFIKDLDDLLTGFMLKKLNHQKGKRSPVFHRIVDESSRNNLIFDRETKKIFNRIHTLRTKGLHRLEKNLSRDNIPKLAIQIYLYFQYFDEFQESQKDKTIKHEGRKYRRIKYGNEVWLDENGKPYLDSSGKPYDSHALAGEYPCHDCYAVRGQYHCFGCDWERCPVCKGQAISCGCGLDDDIESIAE